jgi:hypothetical protein
VSQFGQAMAMIGMLARKASPEVARFAAPFTFIILVFFISSFVLGGRPLLIVISGGLRERQDHLLVIVRRSSGRSGLGRGMGGFPPVPCLTPTERLPQRSRSKVRQARAGRAGGRAQSRPPRPGRNTGRRRVGLTGSTASCGVLLTLGRNSEPAGGQCLPTSLDVVAWSVVR